MKRWAGIILYIVTETYLGKQCAWYEQGPNNTVICTKYREQKRYHLTGLPDCTEWFDGQCNYLYFVASDLTIIQAKKSPPMDTK